MVMYDNEYQTKQNKNWAKGKIEHIRKILTWLFWKFGSFGIVKFFHKVRIDLIEKLQNDKHQYTKHSQSIREKSVECLTHS